MPHILLNKDVGLVRLFEESYAGWTQGRTTPSATAASGKWSDIAAYVEGSGTNAFVANMTKALTELYGLGDGGITEGNWAELDSRVREKHADPRWSQHVLDRVISSHYAATGDDRNTDRLRALKDMPQNDRLDRRTGKPTHYVAETGFESLQVDGHR